MKEMSRVKRACLCALCIALCYVLPIVFHALGAGGAMSPMHLPVLLCGLICGPVYGLVCGVIGPALSSLLSGMPPAIKLLSMIPELAVYGLGCGLLMKYIRTGRVYADLYLSLVPAILAGRIIGGAAKALVMLSDAKPYSLALWATGYFAETLPGTVLQLVLLPTLVFALMKAKAIPPRYPRKGGPSHG